MYEIQISKVYKKQRKKLSEKDKELIDEVVEVLANGQKLDKKYKEHALKGKYIGFLECHIKPDLLLVYRIYEDVLVLFLASTGSHSEIFG